MPYVLQRTDGAFVAPPGERASYTRDLTRARTFSTTEAADRERCPENERVVHTGELLRPAER